MFKRLTSFLAIVLSVVCLFLFVACGKNDSTINDPTNQPPTSSTDDSSGGGNEEKPNGDSSGGGNEEKPNEKEDDYSRDEEVQDYAQNQIKANIANSYLNNLESSPTKTLTDEEVAKAKKDGLLQNIELSASQIPNNKKVIYKKRSAEYGMNDLMYFGANNNITFPGSLLKINGAGTELAPIIGLKRKPITLSLGLEGATNVDYQRKEVSNIMRSTVGQAINDLVKGFTQENSQLPFVIAMQLTEVKAKEELNATLGLSFNAGSFFNLSSEFDFQTKKDQTYAVLTLKQIYYTVNVDYDFSEGVFSLLDDNVTLSKMKTACSEDYCPVYVSSVSYGRIAAITLKTSDSFKELSAKLNIKGGVGSFNANLSSELEGLSKVNDLHYNWFVYGGSIDGNQDVLNGSSINDMINSLNQPYNPSKVVGVPIYYQLSHIADNSSAKMGFVGDYYYAELVDAEPTIREGMRDNIYCLFSGEKKVEDNYGNYDSYGAGYIANNHYIKVDISKLDLDYIKNIGYNLEIKIELSIKEIDDGYQEVYIYNAGVSPSQVQSGKAPIIACAQIEHGVNTTNKQYEKYILKGVISTDSITKNELWIAFDAWGNKEDTWYAKDIKISLNKTKEKTYSMYPTKA